jgi:Ca2+-binding RTX toxin-like protein
MRKMLTMLALALTAALAIGTATVLAHDGSDDNGEHAAACVQAPGSTGDDKRLAREGEGTSGDDNESGDQGDDNINGHEGDDEIDGHHGDDDLCGDKGDDDLNGGPGNDDLDGGPGNDTIKGGTGDDSEQGDSGKDDLTGGPGSDVLSSGSGNDRIHSRDGRRDRIRCGRGHDVVTADRKDRVSGCERVKRS